MEFRNLLGCSAFAVVAGFAAAAAAQGQASSGGQPFGSKSDVEYAHTLWKALEQAKLAGPHRILARPYKSSSRAHGAVLGTMKTELSVHGRTGEVIVKNNYGPKYVSLSEVWQHPEDHLKSVTVMFKREKGYAPKSNDWFWVQYKPDSSLGTANGMEKAGQVKGCISCHTRAKNGFVFSIGGK